MSPGSSSSSSKSNFERISDDLVIRMGYFVAAYAEDIRDFAHFSNCCKRFRELFYDQHEQYHEGNLYSTILNSRSISGVVITPVPYAPFTSLAQVALCEKLHPLDHRLAFTFASVEVSDDDEDNALIQKSKYRLKQMVTLYHQFTNATGDFEVCIEAHSGTAAPANIAGHLSLARGVLVAQQFLETGNDSQTFTSNSDQISQQTFRTLTANLDEEQGGNGRTVPQEQQLHHQQPNGARIRIRAWGSQISRLVVTGVSMNAPVEYARQGKGWVEVYFLLDGMELPYGRRPSCYSGMEPGRSAVWMP